MNTFEMLTEEIFKIIDDIIYEDNVKEAVSDYPSKVIFNPPATIVIFNDGTKIISKCDKEDKFSKTFLFICFCRNKLILGCKGNNCLPLFCVRVINNLLIVIKFTINDKNINEAFTNSMTHV